MQPLIRLPKAKSGPPAHSRRFVGRLRSFRRKFTFDSLSLPMLAAVGGALAFLVLTQGGSQGRAAVPVAVGLDRIAAGLGFGLMQVDLSGHVQTPAEDIFRTIEAADRHSLPAMDLEAARHRLKSLPWIADVELHRQWPNALRVRVVERAPFAIWESEAGTVLIDQTGRHLQLVSSSADLSLLRISGAGANQALDQVKAILARHEAISSEIAEFSFVGERRWRLRLKSGGEVDLPELAPAVALDDVVSREIWVLLREGLVRSVDLRVPGRLIVRRGSGPTLTSANRHTAGAARS